MKTVSVMWQSEEENDLHCLFCGDPINESASKEEKRSQWHTKCVRSFFRTDLMPEIDVSKSELESLVKKTVNRGLTVPGVQKKLSLHLSGVGAEPKLTIVDYPTGYILKPQSDGFKALPESEFYLMKLALKFGIKTVPCALVRMQKQKGAPFAYIIRRVDRIISPGKTKMLAMEDFCQLGHRQTQDKYKSSYEQVGKILLRYSSSPYIDSSELYMRLLFCYLTGNSDMHLKNFSLIETKPGSREFVLSPAYDLLPVNVVMPEDTEEMALSMNGKKNNLTRRDFLNYAAFLKINASAAKKITDRFLDMQSVALDALAESYMPADMKTRAESLMKHRFERMKL